MLTLIVAWLHAGWLSLVFGMSGMTALNFFSKKSAVRPGEQSPDLVLLLGFAIVTVLSSYLSIVLPLNGWVKGGSLLVGLLLTVVHFSELKYLVNRSLARLGSLHLFFKIALGLFLFVCLVEGINGITMLDTKGYHMQAVRWISEYAVVPGLGNLHGRFAFNSHFFIVSSLFSLQVADNLLVFPLNSLLFLLLSGRLLVNIDRSIRHKDWFPFTLNLLLVLTSSYFCLKNINSLSTDVITCILITFTFLAFLRPDNEKDDLFHPVLLAALVAITITFKLSTIFIGLVLLFLLIPFRFRRLAVFAAVGLLVFTPFFYRNYVLSGYLVYPFPGLDLFEAEWKIPQQQVEYEKMLIETWAMRDWSDNLNEEETVLVYANQTFAEWFPSWLNRFKTWGGVFLLNLLALIPFAMSLFKRDYRVAALIFTLLAALTFWFTNAPDPRFAAGFLLFGAALSFAYGVQPILGRFFELKRSYAHWIVGAAILLLGVYHISRDRKFLSHWTAERFLYPHPFEQVPTTTFQGVNFSMEVPPSEPSYIRYCGITPLPCTPYPNANLAKRGDDFQEGFIIVQSEKKE